MLYKMSYKEKKSCTFLEIKKNSKKKTFEQHFCQPLASNWSRPAPGVSSITTILSGRHLAAAKQLFSYLQGSNPGLDCKTLFLDRYTLSGVVMRRATWSLAGASKVLPSLRELGNIVSLPPKLLQRLNKPPGSFPCSIEAKCSTQEALEQVDFGCAARV